jgi:hypothetical protein
MQVVKNLVQKEVLVDRLEKAKRWNEAVDSVIEDHPDYYRKKLGVEEKISTDEIKRRVKAQFAKQKVEKRKKLLKMKKRFLREDMSNKDSAIQKLNKGTVAEILKRTILSGN